ncbi:hypothetical protein HIM_08592 [Hirsutella minnesotensis 3608]|uniref:Inhibitor I9 domain-containing protein n=1 Tax=Hirsutella minnesotensis 3608 TaxID=1043627 RepID=A0A0F7ZH51_9HYPO|nr:hypothetical protein HIM_08592 [Hirsutella minnesotensis 3608]
MKLLSLTIAALALLPGAIAVDQPKEVIIWFEDPNTPASVVDQARNSILKAGGKITHEYTLIKGFAASAPEKALAEVQTQGAGHKMLIEEVKEVSINGKR